MKDLIRALETLAAPRSSRTSFEVPEADDQAQDKVRRMALGVQAGNRFEAMLRSMDGAATTARGTDATAEDDPRPGIDTAEAGRMSGNIDWNWLQSSAVSSQARQAYLENAA
ncbi:hypothetical protein NPA30_04825 [Aurantimonas sp. CSK15Z-1]|nr:hypothetical protein [Aurantimonas sp. CSK15Z-1]